MATIGVYKITNTLTNQCYIGSSIDVEKRLKSHKKNSSNSKLKESIKLNGLGWFTFEIIEICNESVLKIRENHYIKLYNSIEKGFNIFKGNDEVSYKSGRKNIPEKATQIVVSHYFTPKEIQDLGGICKIREQLKQAVDNEANRIKQS